jgi:hypothetical protein
MIHIADINCAGGCLLLEMAAKAKRGIARNQQPGINAPVRVVAGDATFAHRFVLEHKRTGLRSVAFGADVV